MQTVSLRFRCLLAVTFCGAIPSARQATAQTAPAPPAKEAASPSGEESRMSRLRKFLVRLPAHHDFCDHGGKCDFAVLAKLGVTGASMPEVAENVRHFWRVAQQRFISTGSSRVITGACPLVLIGVPKSGLLSIAEDLEKSLSELAGPDEAAMVAALFWSRAVECFSRRMELYYTTKPNMQLDGYGPVMNGPCILTRAKYGKLQGWSRVPLLLQTGSLLEGIKINDFGKFIRDTTPSPFHFSTDYKF
jgi:hypothetical protein